MKTKEEIEQAITFLRNKGILGSGNTVWQVRFADGKLFDIVELMAEFANPKWISVKEQKLLTDEIIHVWHRNELKKGKRCIVGNVWRLCVCLPLAQSFKLPQMLMGQIAQNRCYNQ